MPARYLRIGEKYCSIRSLAADADFIKKTSLNDASRSRVIEISFDSGKGITLWTRMAIIVFDTIAGVAVEKLLLAATRVFIDRITLIFANASRVSVATDTVDVEMENLVRNEMAHVEQVSIPTALDDLAYDTVEFSIELDTGFLRVVGWVETVGRFSIYLTLLIVIGVAIDYLVTLILKQYHLFVSVFNITDVALSPKIEYFYNIEESSKKQPNHTLFPVHVSGADPNSPIPDFMTTKPVVSIAMYSFASDSILFKGVGVTFTLTNKGADNFNNIVSVINIPRAGSNSIYVSFNWVSAASMRARLVEP
ncbi:hypothetical protein RP726_08830 [Candidatus Methylospira mobilis]|uniref:hypothetical protein n=1 Tax=Candidatus Methylospira mobilis TaxID=1808979 RepID=UPI0028E7093C|nr:hypothetical protein [Candidatus Methylospira mobilis]WNV06493.1 hypothetical protein RP726_08830 [Candidatus Methylospira mobilis]